MGSGIAASILYLMQSSLLPLSFLNTNILSISSLECTCKLSSNIMFSFLFVWFSSFVRVLILSVSRNFIVCLRWFYHVLSFISDCLMVSASKHLNKFWFGYSNLFSSFYQHAIFFRKKPIPITWLYILIVYIRFQIFFFQITWYRPRT